MTNDPTQETTQTYDQVAKEYKERYIKDSDKDQMQPYLDLFLELLGENKEVLDIGSGAGFDAKYLSDRGCQIIGIDLSKRMLEIAKTITPEGVFKEMDMRDLKFDDNSFGGVWASASLLHVPKDDVGQVLKEIYRVLDVNGVTLIAVKEGEGEAFVVNKGQGNLAGARRFFAYYRKEELENLLKTNNLELIEYRTNTYRENTWLNFFCRKR